MRVIPSAIAALSMVGLTLSPLPALADDDPSTTTTWSVTPSSSDGPDGRRVFEADVDPGDIAHDFIAVRNFGSETTTFSLSAADGYLTDNGKFNMLTSDRESIDAGTWIALPQTVDVGPGETAIVPVEMAVPEDATPGDHIAGIAASITTAAGASSGVGVESRVGFRTIFHVSGELLRSTSVSSSSVVFHDNINPFLPGNADVSGTILNDGNTTTSITPTLTLAGPFGLGSRSVTLPPVELLPGTSRTLHQQFPAAWPLGWLRATISSEMEGTATSQSTTAVAVPWPQVTLIALIVGVIVWYRITSRRRLAALLDAARQAGAREKDVTHG